MPTTLCCLRKHCASLMKSTALWLLLLLLKARLLLLLRRRRNTAETISTTKRRAKPPPLKESSHHHPSETRWFDSRERKEREKKRTQKVSRTAVVQQKHLNFVRETSQKSRRKNTHKTVCSLKCASQPVPKDEFHDEFVHVFERLSVLFFVFLVV